MKLLIVEDSPGDLRLIQEMLSSGQAENVLPFIDQKDTPRLSSAKELIRTFQPDLVFLDLNLPDSKGLDTFHKFQEMLGDIPIIVLTGTTEFKLGLEAIRCGAQEFLIKGQIPQQSLWKTLLYSLERQQLRTTLKIQKEEVEKQKEKLLEHNERIYSILKSSADGILIVDRKETVRYMNPAAEILLNRSSHDTVGKPVWFPLLSQSLSEITIVKENDGKTILEILVRDLTWEGEPAYIASVRDISQRKTLEERLRNTQKMEAIGRMAGGVAHEFNNLLAIIGGFNQLLSEQGLRSPEAPSWMKKIATAVSRGSTLTKYLLGFTRQGKYEARSLDLNECIIDTLGLIRHGFKSAVKVSTDLEEDLPMVHADKTQMENVLMNIILNSADALEEFGGTIEIKSHGINISEEDVRDIPWYFEPRRYCRILIRDSGTGIKPEHMDKIFEPFFSTKGPGKGTGLGLANVFGIIKNHEGHIICNSQPGNGTTMELYFPVPREKSASQGSTPVTQPLSLENASVLVVDDEKDLLFVMKNYLEGLGLKPITINNGFEAIEFYKKNLGKIEVVFLDLKMPGMGGMEVFYKLKQIHHEVKVILMTGYHRDLYVDRLLKEGAVGYLVKPFQQEDIKSALNLLKPDSSGEKSEK